MENVQQEMKNLVFINFRGIGMITVFLQLFKILKWFLKKTFVFKWVNDRVHLIAEKGNAKCIL